MDDDTVREAVDLVDYAKELVGLLREAISIKRCQSPIRVPLPNPEGYREKVRCDPCGKCHWCRSVAALDKAPEEWG